MDKFIDYYDYDDAVHDIDEEGSDDEEHPKGHKGSEEFKHKDTGGLSTKKESNSMAEKKRPKKIINNFLDEI